MDAMGIDGSPAKGDQEIVDQLKLVWDFWTKNSRSIPLRSSSQSPEQSRAKEALYQKPPMKNWPTVGDYARVYKEHGFIPVMNCSSHTLAFAALLSLTGIPRSQMAIEVMPMTESPSGEHWAVIVQVGGIWHWFDPQYRSASVSGDVERLKSIPSRIDHAAYDKPFKVYLFPGSSSIGVPLCGWINGEEVRTTGLGYDPESPHMELTQCRFMGTEPFWSLRFNSPSTMVFSPWPGAPGDIYKVDSVKQTKSSTVLTFVHRDMAAWMPGAKLYLDIRKQKASDGMSDKVYPLTATVYWNDNRLDGVGEYLEQK